MFKNNNNDLLNPTEVSLEYSLIILRIILLFMKGENCFIDELQILV